MRRNLCAVLVLIAIVAAPFTAQAVTDQTPAALQTQPDDFTRGTVKPSDEGVEAPVAIRQRRPQYTREAMQARIQGTVVVEAVVGVDGRVERARVKTSLDDVLGLDESAVEAALASIFEPGTSNGEPAAVLIELELEFRLH